MSHVPIPLIAFFLFTVAVGTVLFFMAVRGSRVAIGASLIWIAVLSVIALSGFLLVTNTMPPRLLFTVAPPLVLIAALFLFAGGRQFIDNMDLKWSVLIHSVRFLVEINLFELFVYKQLPVQMTFESGNLDILVGMTAPLIWWAFRKNLVGRRGLLIWNGLALLSVLNAVARALLSAPYRFQQFGFDQPTVAPLTFPFVLLPAFLVPVILLCHFAVFRKLATSTDR